jgi:hypothetical protein
LHVESVFEDPVQNRSADHVVVAGLGRDLQGPGAEELAAAAAGLVLGVMDVEVGHVAVGQGTETPVEVASAAAVLAAVGTRMALGGAANDADLRHEYGMGSLARWGWWIIEPCFTAVTSG